MQYIKIVITCWLVVMLSHSTYAACSLTLTPLNFGVYVKAEATSISTDIMLNCDDGDTYSIRASSGNSMFASRHLLLMDGEEKLTYNLFTDAAHTTVWGDGTRGTIVITGTANDSTMIHTVYGQVPANQDLSPGRYTDRIDVTVEF